MADELNVILVVLDCARADHLSCYGYSRETTPFLDRVAREGVRFPYMISAAPWTLPAHASLFTGLFPSTHGVTDENRYLSRRHTTIAEVFQAAGYRTAAFCTNPWVSPSTGFGRGIDLFHTQLPRLRSTAKATLYARRTADRLLRRSDSGARRTNRALLRWIGESKQPFFAFVHYNETHLKFGPPRPYDRLFAPRGARRSRLREVNQDCNKYIAGEVEMSAEDFVILTALYDGELRYVDARLQEVADSLSAGGQWDRTLFIVTSDHGENLGEHHMMSHKFVLYDTLLRVPLLIRCPSQVPQGYVVDEFAQTVDVFPTAAHLAGIAAEMPAIQGRPLIREGRATPGPSFAIAERFRPNLTRFRARYPHFDTSPYDVRKKAIRTKKEKYIWHSDEDNELYDLVVDPGETRNVIDEQPQRAEALRKQLFDWLASVDRFVPEEEQPAIDALMRNQLQSLGYID